ncbi:MAG: hypothetical protein H7061_08280 [Bdellovibrionaceae bacterium]|nr:hypothetical protein [Bdellovibrio sp.]
MSFLKNKKRKFKKSEKGMAIIESIPVLFMLVMVFNFSLGFFGAVHSGILNSIASYNYSLETFPFKSNLVYFRPGGDDTNYERAGNRVHGTTQDGAVDLEGREIGKWPVTLRAITFNYVEDDPKRGLASTKSERNYAGKGSDNNIWTVNTGYKPQEGNSIQTPRIWVKTVYGICITADCGE